MVRFIESIVSSKLFKTNGEKQGQGNNDKDFTGNTQMRNAHGELQPDFTCLANA